ncbi:hypothetical protein ABZX98_27005 [Streptomyces sp. NPDC002992]|uniref:hypothetical protein n=1 Tax=Streptomyces sp. NPDC002992 TaxID=3154273 RepID=UPI0033A6CCEF
MGIDGPRMRRLGRRLGAAGTAMYWHVGSKDSLERPRRRRGVGRVADWAYGIASPCPRLPARLQERQGADPAATTSDALEFGVEALSTASRPDSGIRPTVRPEPRGQPYDLRPPARQPYVGSAARARPRTTRSPAFPQDPVPDLPAPNGARRVALPAPFRSPGDMHPLQTAAEAAATVPAEVVSDSGPSAIALGLGAAALAGAIGTAVVRSRMSKTISGPPRQAPPSESASDRPRG